MATIVAAVAAKGGFCMDKEVEIRVAGDGESFSNLECESIFGPYYSKF